jgi:putative SOS response-associated peptidase YedK
MFPNFRLAATADQLAIWAAVPLSCVPQVALVQNETFPTVHPVLRLSPTTGKRVLSPLRLGLIPSYAHDDHEADHLMEAHAEAMTCCNNFRSAFNRRRCLIPATSFHEFTKVVRPGATPSSFLLENEAIFAIAGVWESWFDDSGRTVETFALIDAHPDPALHSHFDRIPVVIADADQERWLNPQARPLDLLKPLSAAEQAGWKMMPYRALPSLEARLPGQDKSTITDIVREQTYSGL